MSTTIDDSQTQTQTAPRIPSVRLSPDNEVVLANLGLLRHLAGTWEGHGFNLVARPDFEAQANLFLELNLTAEVLKFDPIATSIPNRGVAQDDIELFGLTYLQKISDATTGGALHIEPGIWITQPATTAPPESAPPTQQIVSRMGTIPHGNALLAQGTAAPFSGPPVISPGANPTGGGNPAFSIFPSFNSTTFPTPPTILFAAGSAESAKPVGFSEYNLSVPASQKNPRTPLENVPPILPPSITQELVNDPIILLQQTIEQQLAQGYEFEGTVLNIATHKFIEFFTTINSPVGGPAITVSVTDAGGGIENIPFLKTNADTALVYATFWIEKVIDKKRGLHFMQLQYAQTVLLNFPAILIPGKPLFSWPHVSVGTLRKTFG